jgi:hypothetical protein
VTNQDYYDRFTLRKTSHYSAACKLLVGLLPTTQSLPGLRGTVWACMRPPSVLVDPGLDASRQVLPKPAGFDTSQ